MKKLPDDAFAFYLSQGLGRSHQAVADHYGVDKKTVTNRAVKEGWKQKIEDHEREQRLVQEKKAAESLEAMNDRHLKVIGYIQARGIEALKAMPIESAIDAVRAISLAIEKERLIRGEPTERTAMDIEKKIREEHERWLVPVEPEPIPAPGPEAVPATDAAPVPEPARAPEPSPVPAPTTEPEPASDAQPGAEADAAA
jgi:hypothetical protein